MHSPMAKAVEMEMPEDIEQYTKVIESRTRGIELMVAIRAEALGNGDGIRMLTREDKRDLLEAWEDLQVRAEDGGNSSMVASLEQECDRLTDELLNERRYHDITSGQKNSLCQEIKSLQESYQLNSRLLTVANEDERSITSKLRHENSQLRAELKDQRKELSVLRRALNAANGVIGHFTGRK